MRAREDDERGILYAGDGLACCLGEFFANTEEIVVSGTMAASLRSTAPIVVLANNDLVLPPGSVSRC